MFFVFLVKMHRILDFNSLLCLCLRLSVLFVCLRWAGRAWFESPWAPPRSDYEIKHHVGANVGGHGGEHFGVMGIQTCSSANRR